MNIFNIFWNSKRRNSQQISPTMMGNDIEKSMENLLEELSCYGNPRLAKLDSGWWCYMQASDAVHGVKLNIGSEIRHTHPKAAIAECLQKVRASGSPELNIKNGFAPNRLRN
jgi:hypothetical protein